MALKCAVSLCKCQKTKNNFGIRMQHAIRKIDNQSIPVWETTWAYKIKSDSDVPGSTSSSHQNIEGNILLSDSFPGCPICGNKKIVQCGECSGTLCMDPNQRTVITCPWCNAKLGGVRGGATGVRGSGDR